MTEISTDVDNLIRTIADRKKIQLKDLQKECNIDKKNLDKWMYVLEEEGYIAIQYGLSGTYVLWKGDEAPEKEVVKEPGYEEEYEAVEESFQDTLPLEDVHDEKSEDVPDLPVFDVDSLVEEETERQAEVEAEPEDLLKAYLDKKRAEEIKSSIIGNLDEEPQRPEPPLAPSEPDEPDDSVEESDHDIDFSKIKDDIEDIPETIRPSRDSQAGDLQALMSSYMNEINKEKARINSLKKEKDDLFRSTIAPLEGRMQADIVALTDKIIEKRSRVAELKEHVLELPDKIEEVERLQEGLDKLKEESSQALTRTRDKAESYLSNIENSREDLKERISDVHSSIDEQAKRLESLEKTNQKLTEQSEKIQTYAESVRKQVEALNSSMEVLLNDLKEVELSKEEITEMKDAIRDSIGSHGEELEELDAELNEIGKVEQWVNEYLRDYESKISEIESYVQKSDDELAELREAAESLYLQKYLGELEGLTEAYEVGLDEAAEKENDIDIQINEAKERITTLVRESRDMMKKLRGESNNSDDYAAILSRIKRKTTKITKLVNEKANERAKLLDDSKKSRKTKRTSKTRAAKKKVKKKKK
ncbi:hypothetical protein JXA56_05760 [Candidatus Micrarchaeota archaeon]|nr:hypothetical protein [Candidatus Micrarchaeota archaeon]